MASVFLNSPVWVEKIKAVFSVVDTKKNGFLTPKDYDLWVDNVEKLVKTADPKQIARLREEMRKYVSAFGVIPNVKLTLDQFVEKFAGHAAQEKARYDAGEEPLFFKMKNAWYDVLCENNDSTITLEEYKTCIKASNFDEKDADITFEELDKDGHGKLEKSRLTLMEFKFWCTA